MLAQELLNKPSIHVGGTPDLELIYKLAITMPKLNILVICPERLLKSEAQEILNCLI